MIEGPLHAQGPLLQRHRDTLTCIEDFWPANVEENNTGRL